jgi:LPS-assembly protein
MKIFRLKPAAAILFGLFPACSFAAVNLPPLAVDPGLLAAAPQEAPVSAPLADGVRPPFAEEVPNGFVRLKRTRKLTPAPPDSAPRPVFIQAARIEGRKDAEIEASENAELRQWGQALFADRLIYRREENEVLALGSVRLEQGSNRVEGDELLLKLEKKQGYMNAATFYMDEPEQPGRGASPRLLFEGENRYRLEDASYTTCPAGNDDWLLRADELNLDRNVQTGTATHARLEFLGTPILYAPWMTFPLDRQRKSGFLAPSFRATGRNGSEFSLPYYWNIAPNRDATITPRIIQKRGLQLRNEIRYLEPHYAGVGRAEVLPSDAQLGSTRYSLMLNHAHALAPGLSATLNLNKVSDDDYFRDLGTQLAITSQVNLLREGVLNYALGAWNLTARAQSFQTLQDINAPVTPPYRRVPQLLLSGVQRDVLGADLALTGEYNHFSHPSLPNGQRLVFHPSISAPWVSSWGSLTPKLGWHATRYTLDRDTTALPDVTRGLPVVSLDGTLQLERAAALFGQPYLQTLEPRLFYLYAPYRDQSRIPNFDSAEADFNYARLFSENRFSGSDRINDANHLTLALTSRLLEAESGQERVRATLGQRYYFTDQRVALLSAAPHVRKTSDILALLSGNLSSRWSLDSGWQYDPGNRLTERANLAARYQPETGKILNMGYRYTRESLKQLDFSTQWPLSAKWRGLGRWNYSLADSKLLEGLLGLEYDAGCWVFRSVLHNYATAAAQNTSAIFFQLELSGIGHIGSNPFDVLQRNIYGYSKTHGNPHEPTENY